MAEQLSPRQHTYRILELRAELGGRGAELAARELERMQEEDLEALGDTDDS